MQDVWRVKNRMRGRESMCECNERMGAWQQRGRKEECEYWYRGKKHEKGRGKENESLACNNVQGTDSGGMQWEKQEKRRNWSFYVRDKWREESNAIYIAAYITAFYRNFPSPHTHTLSEWASRAYFSAAQLFIFCLCGDGVCTRRRLYANRVRRAYLWRKRKDGEEEEI